MKFSDFDNFLRADHLTHSTTVVIESFQRIETHPRPGKSEMALAVRFKGKQKPLILSTVNRRKLASMFGDDTDAAIGKTIVLAVEQVTVAGAVKQVIRIRAAQPEVKLAENRPLANTTAVPDTDSSAKLSDVAVIGNGLYARTRDVN